MFIQRVLLLREKKSSPTGVTLRKTPRGREKIKNKKKERETKKKKSKEKKKKRDEKIEMKKKLGR